MIKAAVSQHNDKASWSTPKIYSKTYGSGDYACTDITTISFTIGEKTSVNIDDFLKNATISDGIYTLDGSTVSVSTSGEKTVTCSTGEHKFIVTLRHTGAESATVSVDSIDYYLGAGLNLANGLKTASSAPNSITIGATKDGENSLASLTATTVDLAAVNGITVKTGSSVTATDGAVTLNGGTQVSVAEGSAVQGKTGVTLTATNGITVGGASHVSATDGAVTLNGGTQVAVSGGASVSGSSVTLNGTTVKVSGADTLVKSTTGNVALNGTGSAAANTIETGAGVSAGQDVLLSNSAGGNNKISGSTVTAGRNVSLSTPGKIGGLLDVLNPVMPGENTITNSSVTATTGGVTLTGMTNQIAGSTVAAQNEVKLNALLSNTISGSNTHITSSNGITVGSSTTLGGIFSLNTFINEVGSGKLVTTGQDADITLKGLMNMVGDGDSSATLESQQGSISVAGTPQPSWTEGWVMDLVIGMIGGNAGFKDTLKGFGLVNEDDTIKTDLVKILMQQSGNIIQSGSTLKAADDVSMSGKVNLVRSSTLTAGENVIIDGGANAMMGATISGKNVEFKTSSANTLNLEQIAQLLPLAGSLLGESEYAGISIADVETLLNSLPADSLKGVTASANVLAAGRVEATDTVTLTGTANALMGGADVFAKNITLSGVDTKLPLSALANAALANENLKGMLEGMLPGGVSLELLTPVLNSSAMTKLENGFSANLVYGGNTHLGYGGTETVTMTALGNVVAQNSFVEGKDVTMTALGNVVAMGSKVTGHNTVTMDGMANLVYDATVSGSTIKMGMSAGNKYANLLTTSDLISILPDTLGEYDISRISGALSTFADSVTMEPINVNVVMGQDATVGGGNTASVTMDGTANVLIAGAQVQGNTVSMTGTANMVLGGSGVFGTNIEMLGKPLQMTANDATATTSPLATLAGAMLESNLLAGKLPLDKLPAGTTDILVSAVDKVSDQLSVNLVYGGISNVGNGSTQKVTMEALGNIVAQNAYVQAQDVTMTGLANVVALKANNGSGATVHGSNSVTMDGMLNVVYDGIVKGGDISMGMDKNNSYSGALSLDELADSIPNEMLTGMFGDTLGTQLGSFKDALPGLITDYGPGSFNMNLVMGPNARLDGKSVNLGGVVNMLSDRVQVKATNMVDISGFANIVTDGTTITSGDMSLAGTLNFVSHLNLNDVASVLGGGELPERTIVPTKLTAAGNLVMWGTANVVQGSVEISSTHGNMTMEGMNDPILNLDKLTIDQCVALAEQMGLDKEQLTELAGSTLGELLARAQVSNDEALVEEAKAVLNKLLTNYNGVEIPKDLLYSNVNLVLGGAKVQALNGMVTMNGTANVLYDNAVVQGQTVTMKGMGNVVLGGANVYGNDIKMEGVNKNMHLGAVGSLMLDSGVLGDIELPSGLLSTLNTLEGSANLVYGGSTNVAATGNVTMDALANIVAKNAHVDAGDKVNMSGALNMVAANAAVNAKNISLLGGGESFIDWSAMEGGEYAGLISLVQGVDPNMNVVADGAQLAATERLWLDASANVIMGGADLQAKTIDIISGGANVVVDTTLQNIADTLQGDTGAIAAGGKDSTTLTADKKLTLTGVANAVNGKVTLKAGEEVSITGAGNLLSGNAQVEARDVTLTGAQSDTVNALVNALPGDYSQLAKDLGTEAFGSANVVMGGADVTADNDVKISGGLNVVADATLSDMLTLVDKDDTTWPGAGAETVVTAGNDIAIDGMANVVMGDGAKLDAGNNVTMSGTAAIVSADAVVKAGNDIVLSSSADNGELYGIADSAMQHDTIRKIADTFVNNGAELLAQLNEHNSANVVMDGASLQAGNDVKFSGGLNVLDTATVTAGKNIEFGEGVTSIKNTNLTATGGRVLLSSNTTMDGGNIVAGAGLSIKGDSEVMADSAELDGMSEIAATAQVTIDELFVSGELMNEGQLTVGTADFSNTSVVNAGQMAVTGGLTLDNTALTFHMTDSLGDGMISGNSSAIVLNSLDSVTLNSISLVTFVVTLDGLTNGTYDFNLDLFVLASDYSLAVASEGESLWQSALTGDKVRISLVDASGNSVDYRLNNMTVQTGNTVTVSGSLTIPEPTTATLSLLALAALAARRRRK